jgi:hypothetical protein
MLPPARINGPIHCPPKLQQLIDSPDYPLSHTDIHMWLNGIIQDAVNQEREHWRANLSVYTAVKHITDDKAQDILLFGHSYGEPLEALQQQLDLHDEKLQQQREQAQTIAQKPINNNQDSPHHLPDTNSRTHTTY